MLLSPDMIKFLAKERYYVIFPDGSWRTCEGEQWKEERVYKIEGANAGWFHLKEFDLTVMRKVIERLS